MVIVQTPNSCRNVYFERFGFWFISAHKVILVKVQGCIRFYELFFWYELIN